MKPCNVVCRLANLSDDIKSIAKYIHLTDPYIYPSICASPEDVQWVNLIEQCYHAKNNLFSVQNVFVATEGEKIIGVCCVIPCGKRMSFLEDATISPSFFASMTEALNGYFIPLLNESAEWEGYNVVNLCVDPYYRGQGVGKKLLDYCLMTHPKKTFYLDVIADNARALAVYHSLGFEIIKEYKGFSGGSTTVLCYQMKRDMTNG